MPTIEKKKRFWKDLWSTLLGKAPYIIMGVFYYPFIQRTKVREKINKGNFSWYTKQLWYMLNDDELKRYDVDYDIGKIGRATTRLGHFLKSYSFNALRNPAYNFSLTHQPIINKYDVQEIEWSTLTRDGKDITPLTWARWTWRQKDGSLNNIGETISLKDSTIGSGKIWFDPLNGLDVWYCRWSKAVKYSYLLWDVYHTFRIGAFGQRYDIVVKFQHRLKFSVKRRLVKIKKMLRFSQ